MKFRPISPPVLCLWRSPKVVETLTRDFESAKSVRGRSAWALRRGKARTQIPPLSLGGVLAYRPEDVVRYSVARRRAGLPNRGPRLFDALIKPLDETRRPMGLLNTPRARAAGEVERLLSNEVLGAAHLVGWVIRTKAAGLRPTGGSVRFERGRILIPVHFGRLKGQALIALLQATLDSLEQRAAEARQLARRERWTDAQVAECLGVSARWLRSSAGRLAVPLDGLTPEGSPYRYRRETLLNILRGVEPTSPWEAAKGEAANALEWLEHGIVRGRQLELEDRLKTLRAAVGVLGGTLDQREAYARFEVLESAVEVRFTVEAVLALLVQLRQNFV
jgi:hypothetical protein